MGEVNAVLSLVPAILSTIKTIQDTCSTVDPGVLPPNRRKLDNLKTLIVDLERKMQRDFPILANLTSVYSAVVADVKVAQVLADKNYELLGFLEESKSIYQLLIRVPGEMERQYIDVDKGLSNLPVVDSAEFGEAQAIIKQIGTFLDRLKQLKLDNQDSTSILSAQGDSKQLIKDVASKYGDLDRVLSKLLKRIGSLGIVPKIVYWYTIMTLLVRQNHCTARVLVI